MKSTQTVELLNGRNPRDTGQRQTKSSERERECDWILERENGISTWSNAYKSRDNEGCWKVQINEDFL